MAALRTLGARGAGVTLDALGPLDALGALRSGRALGALRPLETLGASGALKPLETLETLRSLRPLAAWCALGALRPGGSLKPHGPLETLRSHCTLGTTRPGGALETLRTDCAGGAPRTARTSWRPVIQDQLCANPAAALARWRDLNLERSGLNAQGDGRRPSCGDGSARSGDRDDRHARGQGLGEQATRAAPANVRSHLRARVTTKLA